jgi:NADH-quinone oxidoreductase subunit M
MGTYGFVRFSLPLLPSASIAFTPFIMTLAVIGIVYGAFLALAQQDIKKMVAYSSVSHLGFVMVGVFAMNRQGMDGGVLQMINHGLSTGGLFLIIGMIYERRHTRMMDDFGGLSKVMPIYTFFTAIIVLSSIALPGTNGFIGELLILIGLFKYSLLPAAIAIIGVVVGPIYMLGMFRRVVFGKLDNPKNKVLKDLNTREVLTLLPIVILILWIGLYPKTFLGLTSASTAHLLDVINVKHAQLEGGSSAALLAIEAVPAAEVTPEDEGGIDDRS